MVAKLITCGLGKKSALVTIGMGGPLHACVEACKRIIRAGQSGTKRVLEEMTIYMKLLRVNGKKIISSVTSQTLKVNEHKHVSIEHIETKKSLDEVKVTVHKT